KHLEIDHPYNTYQTQGLPPGPITNSSPSSLRAATGPERHEYLYFAADGTGGHTFSRTLQEHNRAAQKYQRLLDRRGEENSSN
ncbi:MAG: endolytic transglycosylase MltG, partial [Bacteroidetes bacterium QH_1_64_81]